MALRITKAADPILVETLTLVLYGQPAAGKTSIAFTADRPLLLDFDGGVYRSEFRQDTVQITSWDDVSGITAEDFAPYATVIVDTAGRALDVLTADIIRKNPKMKGFGGALSLQGYGALKSAFIAWLRMLHSFGKDVILIAHMDEQRNGDELIERLDVQGGSKGEIYKVADAMARLYIHEGKRTLNFNPTDVAYGKNPAQLAVLTVPNFTAEPHFLAGVIAGIKAKLNATSEAAMVEQARMQAWRDVFAELTDLADFNAKIDAIKDEAPKVKGLLLAAGEAKGYAFDKKAKQFVAPAQAAA